MNLESETSKTEKNEQVGSQKPRNKEEDSFAIAGIVGPAGGFAAKVEGQSESLDGAEAKEVVQNIFGLLHRQTGHDFSLYKENTINRRIERRMTLNRIENVQTYARVLEENPLEVELLYKELLIGVTSFFRDREAFAALESKVIPLLFQDRKPEDSIRVWVVGCSTGEEAYSIAILIYEQMIKLDQRLKVQIFATDIDDGAIEKGRRGIYPDRIAADVPAEYLAHFFTKKNNGYRVKEEIRNLIIFAVQSVVKDPPFSNLDLISCRNLLIYLKPELQNEIIPLFQYALNPNGYLFVGSSETLGRWEYLFTPIDRKWRLFQRLDRPLALYPEPGFPISLISVGSKTDESSGGDKPLNLGELTEKILLEDHAPSCVVIDERADICYFHGRTGKYLEPPAGEVNFNLLNMAREGLQLPLTVAVRKWMTGEEAVVQQLEQVKTNGETHSVRITIKPVPDAAASERLALVIFEDVEDSAQLESKLNELSRMSSVMSTLLSSLEPVTIFLDTNLCIQHFTPAVTQIVNLVDTDIGRPIDHFATNLVDENLAECAQTAYETLQSRSKEVRTKNGQHFWMQVRLCGTGENQVDGVVLTFSDVSQQKRAQKAQRESEVRLLLNVIEAIGKATDFEAALQVALDLVCEETNWVLGEVWLPNADQSRLEASQVYYCRDEVDEGLRNFRTACKNFTFAPNEGLPGRVWSLRKPIWEQDVSQLSGADYLRVKQAQTAGLKAALAVPVRSSNDVLAVIVLYKDESQPEDQRAVALISAVAAQLSGVFERKRTVTALHQSEMFLRSLYTGTDVAITLIDVTDSGEFVIAGINPALERMSGRSEESVRGKQLTELDPPANPEVVAETEGHCRRCMETGEVVKYELSAPVRGVEAWWLVWLEPLQNQSGQVYRIISTAVPITERKIAEETLRRANGILEALAEWYQMLLHADQEEDVLLEMCRIIVEIGGYHSVWIGYAEQDEAKQVKPMAHMCIEEEELQKMNVTWDDAEEVQHPAGKTIRTGQVVLIRDVETNEDYQRWRDEAHKRGYSSTIALPLKSDGHIFGALSIYAEEDAFHEQEVALLQTLADNLAYGVRSLRNRLT